MSGLSDKIRRLKSEIDKLIQENNYNQIPNLIDAFQLEIEDNEKSEFFFKKIFDNSLSGFGIAKTNGEILDCNLSLTKLLGFNKIEDVKKHNIKDFYGDISERKVLLDKLELDGYVREFKLKIKTFDNRKIIALINANILKNGSDESIVIVNFKDITEKETITKDLVENEKYLDFILNSVNSGVLLIDPLTHKIIDANAFALNMMNNDKCDVVGKECFQFVCPAEKGKCPITDLNEDINESVRILLTRTGKEKCILKSAKNIEINGRTIILETFTDIGRQIEAEAELKEFNESLERKVKESTRELKKSETKFRAFSDLSPSAISIQRRNKYFYVNKAWSEITGYKVDELKDIGPYDIIHPEWIDFVKEMSSGELKREGVKLRYEVKIVTKDKKIKWLDVSISTIFYEDEFASIAVSNDITHIREVRDALKGSEAKYRSLIENLKHEYFFYRHNLKGKFEYVSPSLEQVLGYTAEEFLTDYNNYLTDNEINEIAKQKTDLAFLGIQQLPYEIEIYDIQKHVHILEISESPIIDSEGNVLGVEGIAHDITSQRRAENTVIEQLEEIKSINEELNSVNDDLQERIDHINRLNKELKESESRLKQLIAQKDRFFSIIAHDLRSPVSNFVQTSDLLKMNSSEMSKENMDLFINELSNLANSTLKLLENLLMWSRSQLGHLDVNYERICLYDVIEDIRNLFSSNLKSKDIRLSNNLDETNELISDKNIIHTVLRNLINNAIKFTPFGGSIIVRLYKVELNKCTLEIEDNGVGIPEDKIERLFDIDDDYTTPGTEKEKGTGLGLVLCKELIEKIGGSINVTSNLADIEKGLNGKTVFQISICNKVNS